jgi:glycerol-3-phosphate acyltransferase PlsX
LADIRRIAIDVMGGDSGPSVTVPASISALRRHACLHLVLVGNQVYITPHLVQLTAEERSRVEVLHTEIVFSSQSRPDSIVRNGRDSSMFLAVEQVRSGATHACVSAGNTGALLLAGRHLLKNIPGVDKPAIMALVPASHAATYTYLLDVGANIECTAAQLYQFALMGSVMVTSLSGQQRARVALLNIGEEDYKGRQEIRDAAELLSQCEDVEYRGFVEGNQIFDGHNDVIVCDGFTGNIVIKTSAGAVKVVQAVIEQSIGKHWCYRVFACWMRPLLRDLQQTLNPSKYNGATLVGLQGIIVKSHGNADRAGFEQAIEHACKQISDDIPQLIANRMAKLLPTQPA